jgi:thiamine biosynthesis lipoprotein
MAIILTAIWKLHGSPVIAQGARVEYAQLHLGMEIRLVLHAPQARADSAARDAFARIAELEQILSDWRPESEVRRLARRGGEPTPVSETLFEVTARALAMSRASAGAFDPTVAPLVLLWRETRKTGRIPGDSATTAARALIGWSRITLDWRRRTVLLPRGMQFDLGGIAKGWILGEAARLLELRGITSYLIEGGGDLVVGEAPSGTAGWRVEVATTQGDSVLTLTRTAIATSGPSAQFVVVDGVRYSHVIDPRTGTPLHTPLAVTVVHPDPATADALATAITILGEREGSRLAARLGATMIRRRD